MTLDEESARSTALLRGKMIKRISRHREQEVMIEFEDGSRHVDSELKLELSITPSD